jgi:alkylhydroperoxidase family enzyme
MADTPIQRLPRARMSESQQQAWDMVKALNDQPALIETLANAPELLEFLLNDFYQAIFFGGRVDNRFKQLARLRLSLAHGCRSCNLMNRTGTREAGFCDAHIAAIEADRSIFTDAERAVLAFADEMLLTNPGGKLQPELYHDLKTHFDDAQIMELSMVMGILCGMAKMAFVIDVVDKEDYCVFAAN